MTSVELSWLAGIVEGEGTFSRPGRTGQVRVIMTDHDVVRRLAAVTGLGVIRERPRRQAHYRIAWDWHVVRQASVKFLACALAPLLLDRRRAAVGELLAGLGGELPAPVALSSGSPEAWAWLAGLVEGEGWILPGPSSQRRQPVIGVESTDLDVIQRLEALAGVGQISALRRQKPGWKPSWRWTVTNRADANLFLTAISPLLGERRGTRAGYVRELLAA